MPAISTYKQTTTFGRVMMVRMVLYLFLCPLFHLCELCTAKKKPNRNQRASERAKEGLCTFYTMLCTILKDCSLDGLLLSVNICLLGGVWWWEKYLNLDTVSRIVSDTLGKKPYVKGVCVCVAGRWMKNMSRCTLVSGHLLLSPDLFTTTERITRTNKREKEKVEQTKRTA